MNYNLEIAFDFENSEEYFAKYYPTEITDSNKIPKDLRDKKFYRFEKIKPEAKPIGTSLLEFLNLDFSDYIHLNYFLVHYFLINFISSHKNYRSFEYYKGTELTFKDMDNPQLILTDDELRNFGDEAKLLYFDFIESAQYVFKSIVDKVYFKTLFESSTEQDSDYEKLKKLKDNETYESVLNDISENFKDIKMNFDLNNFFLNNIPKKAQDNIKYFYSSNDFACLLYISLKELINNKKSFRVIKCDNCDYYFIPKTAHKTLYCDEIFEGGKTCKEYVSNLGFSRTFANNLLCNKYRRRYKNLQQETVTTNNPAVILLYERYKSEGKIMLDKYQHGKITAEEFENWIDGMKIRK